MWSIIPLPFLAKGMLALSIFMYDLTVSAVGGEYLKKKKKTRTVSGYSN